MISSKSIAARLTVDRKRSRRRDASALIEACLNGEKTAWDDLVEQYGRLVYSIARRCGLDDADADDVFQSVFLTVMEKLRSLRQRERFSAWLITITHRECWRTKQRSGGGTELDANTAAGSPPSEEEVLRREQQHLVQRALEELGGSCEPLLRALRGARPAQLREDRGPARHEDRQHRTDARTMLQEARADPHRPRRRAAGRTDRGHAGGVPRLAGRALTP